MLDPHQFKIISEMNDHIGSQLMCGFLFHSVWPTRSGDVWGGGETPIVQEKNIGFTR